MIQSHTPVIVGTGTPFNVVGAWAELIAEVTATSVWSLFQASRTTSFPSGTVMQSLNFELGIGPLNEERRVWKSMFLSTTGSELEYDDSWWVRYVPFNFPKGARITCRTATIGSVVQLDAVQLQLYS